MSPVEIIRKKILLIEDDREIVELLNIHLKDIFCDTSTAHNTRDGSELSQKNKYDLIILDIMLPDGNGFDICRKVREEKNHTPILMLSARSEEIDKVIGLETGADDYLTKPFSIRELLARIKALLRRSEMTVQQPRKEAVTIGDLSIEPMKRKVMMANRKVELTPREFDLLYLFMTNPGRSYSRDVLLNTIWGYDFNGYEHTVNSHINRLRAKIEPELSHPQYILTSWGSGYRFTDEM